MGNQVSLLFSAGGAMVPFFFSLPHSPVLWRRVCGGVGGLLVVVEMAVQVTGVAGVPAVSSMGAVAVEGSQALSPPPTIVLLPLTAGALCCTQGPGMRWCCCSPFCCVGAGGQTHRQCPVPAPHSPGPFWPPPRRLCAHLQMSRCGSQACLCAEQSDRCWTADV